MYLKLKSKSESTFFPELVVQKKIFSPKCERILLMESRDINISPRDPCLIISILLDAIHFNSFSYH
jgi:hypothetical protein